MDELKELLEIVKITQSKIDTLLENGVEPYFDLNSEHNIKIDDISINISTVREATVSQTLTLYYKNIFITRGRISKYDNDGDSVTAKLIYSCLVEIYYRLKDIIEKKQRILKEEERRKTLDDFINYLKS